MELDLSKVNQELIRQGMKCETAEALKTLAQEHQIELDDVTARELLAKIKDVSGALSDSSLGNVSGGRLWLKRADETEMTIDDPDTMLIKWNHTEKHDSKF